jgi:ureidoacrylate peracid hydrolase
LVAVTTPTALDAFLELEPRQVAVVMVDFQNDFCSPEVFAAGQPVTNTHNAETARRASRFAAGAAALGAHVVYTRQVLDMNELSPRQRRWEQPDGLCAAGSWGAELFLPPVPGSRVVAKHRFDCWQSSPFTEFLDEREIDGLVIAGVELVCCVLYAVLGAAGRGYHYLVPRDLVSGQDPGDRTDNKAVRDYLAYNHGQQAVPSAAAVLNGWQHARS